jgi:hypothetical protein
MMWTHLGWTGANVLALVAGLSSLVSAVVCIALAVLVAPRLDIAARHSVRVTLVASAVLFYLATASLLIELVFSVGSGTSVVTGNVLADVDWVGVQPWFVGARVVQAVAGVLMLVVGVRYATLRVYSRQYYRAMLLREIAATEAELARYEHDRA